MMFFKTIYYFIMKNHNFSSSDIQRNFINYAVINSMI